MSFRVTTSLQIDRSIYDINAANQRLDNVQNDLSTGKRIHRPSDDPTANARAMVMKTTIAENKQYLSNIQSAHGFVQATDTAITSYVSSLQRLRQLAVQGANGSLDANAKAAIATEANQIREEIRTVANTQYNGRYIFGGIKTDQQPFPTDVTLAPGDQGALHVDIAPGITMQYNVNSVQLFGDTVNGTNNIFSVIDNFTNLLSQNTSSPDVSQQTIQDIDNWMNQVGNNRTTVGGWQNRLDMGTQHLTDANTSLQNLLGNVEDTNIADASLQMNQSQATLQAALEVGSKAMPLTLVDFLK